MGTEHRTVGNPKIRRVLLLAEGFRLQYKVLRCAAACFDEVYVLGTSEALSLRLSLFCKHFVPTAYSFKSSEEMVINQINKLCNELLIDCVLPSCADTTRFLCEISGKLTVPHYPVPSHETFDKLNNKWLFANLCTDLGISHPNTMLFRTRTEFANSVLSGSLSFPLIIKPLSMWGSFGVTRADTPSDALNGLNYEPILVQEYIPGSDSSAFYLCQDGRLVCSIIYRRTPKGVKFLKDSRIDDKARVIIEHLNYNGVIGFDIRHAPNDEVIFIECNPRFWYRIEIALLAGINFVDTRIFVKSFDRKSPKSLDSLEILSLLSAIKALMVPWKLSRHDISFLLYLLRDPLPNLWVGIQRMFGANKLAQGQQFMWLMLIFPEIEFSYSVY